MYIFVFTDNNNTIITIKITIKKEYLAHCLALLKNYLKEKKYLNSSTSYEIMSDQELANQPKENLYIENKEIFIEEKKYTISYQLHNDLGYEVEIKTDTYTLLRPYSVYILINLLKEELFKQKKENMIIEKEIIDKVPYIKLEFSEFYKIFFSNECKFNQEKYIDYLGITEITEYIDIEIDSYAPTYVLKFYYGIDEMETEYYRWQVESAENNQKYEALINDTYFATFRKQLTSTINNN